MQIGIPALVQALAASPTRGSGDPEAVFEALIWFGGLVLAALMIALAVLFLRKWFRRQSDSAVPGFTLDELRRLRDRGDLTIKQYEALRDRMVREQQARM